MVVSHQSVACSFVNPCTWEPAVAAACRALLISREPIAISCEVRNNRATNPSPSFPEPPMIAIFIKIDLFLPDAISSRYWNPSVARQSRGLVQLGCLTFSPSPGLPQRREHPRPPDLPLEAGSF